MVELFLDSSSHYGHLPHSILITLSSISKGLTLFKHLFIDFWLLQVIIAACGLSLVAASGSCSLVWCVGFSLCGFSCCRTQAPGVGAFVVAALWLQSTGLVVVAHGHSRPATCGIFLDQGSKRYPLHWQVDFFFLTFYFILRYSQLGASLVAQW